MPKTWIPAFAGMTTLLMGVMNGCVPKKLPLEMGNPKWGVDVTWHGQSSFTFKDSVGRTVVVDPFDETIGYGWLKLRADAVLITHRHFDHDYLRAVKPKLKELDVVESTGSLSVASGLNVTGIAAFHDNEEGQINGPNRIYFFMMGGLRMAHLGDLGQPTLTELQKSTMGQVDVLFIPVGGFVTVDAEQAKAIVDTMKPSVVFPMHYGNTRFYKLDPVEKFTGLFDPAQVNTLDDSRVRLRVSDLTDKPVVYVLKPTAKNK